MNMPQTMASTPYEAGRQYMAGECSATDIVNLFCSSNFDLKSFEHSLAGGIAACEGEGKALASRQQPIQDKQATIAYIYRNGAIAKKDFKQLSPSWLQIVQARRKQWDKEDKEKKVETMKTAAEVLHDVGIAQVEPVTEVKAHVQAPVAPPETAIAPAPVEEPVIVAAPVESQPSAAPVPTKRRIGHLASEITPIAQEWTWENFIPNGDITLLAADSGMGKSSILREVTRALTTGTQLPDFSPSVPCSVLWISFEESESKITLALQKCGADTSKVLLLNTVTPEIDGLGESAERPFRFPQDVAILREALEDESLNIGMVVIDSISCLSDKSIAHMLPARKLMLELQEIAHFYSVAIIAINHLTKGRDTSVQKRMAGSIGLYNAYPTILTCVQDTRNPRLFSLKVDKHNHTGDITPLTYTRSADGGVEFTAGVSESAKLDFEAAQEKKTAELILEYVEAHPQGVQARQVTYAVRRSYDSTRKMLARMVDEKRLYRTERGMYSTQCPINVPSLQLVS